LPHIDIDFLGEKLLKKSISPLSLILLSLYRGHHINKGRRERERRRRRQEDQRYR